MTIDQVDRIMSDYKKNVARACFLRAQIRALELNIEDVEAAEIDIGTRPLSDMPRGTGVGDPTAHKAILLASGFESEEFRLLKNDLNQQTRELHMTEISIEYVEAWLQVLTDRERWVVERQTFDKMTWRDSTASYNEHFSDYIGKDQLKRIKAKAREKIYEIAQ